MTDMMPGAVTSGPTQTESDFVAVFRRRCRLTPDAAAVVFDGAAITFAELDRRSDALAARLNELVVGPDAVVAVLVHRSPHLPVALLAVLKAGAAFLPLDPGYPAERLSYQLGDAGAQVLITEEAVRARLSTAGVALPDAVVLVEQERAERPRIPSRSTAIDPDSLAYVIYTSGSTGRPKGVMIEHRSLAVFSRDVAERIGLGAGDRFLQFASPGFDVLIEELFPTWSVGAALVIPTRHLINGEDDLVALIERERVTVIELPTAYWHEWVRELHRTDTRLPAGLRLVIIGGERVLPQRLELWRSLHVPLMHVYGLTETTVSSTFFRVDPADPTTEWPNLPIGTGLPSAELHVLDRRLRPVPDGGTGELYIGGVSVARGYLGQPGLTAQRFVADPRPDGSGRRLYRTGDVVRRRPDRQLEFISRVDHQLKIRGFRVEPMEIEAVLVRHPGVAECVVTVYEPQPGDRRLVAHLVLRGDQVPTAELRAWLERELPAYMVPSAFVELAELPLNANGKIDRDRLPAPQLERKEPEASEAESATPVQRRLAEVIAAVVGTGHVGLHDNFFEIGGDSILAIQVVARAQEAGLQLTPYDLFAQPTVASLADVISSGVSIDAAQGEVTGPVPQLPVHRRFVAAGVAEPQHHIRSVLLELATTVDPDFVARAVELVLEHHDGLRQRLLFAGERTRCRIAPVGDPVPLLVHDVDSADEAELGRRMAELPGGLDLAVGPMLQVALFRFGGARPDRLAIVAHELVADHLSLQIVLEDLETAMVQQLAGEELRFLPKTTSWQAWGRRLSGWARSDEAAEEHAYWSGLVATPTTPLPLERARGVAAELPTEASARTLLTTLDAVETDALTGAVPQALHCRVEEALLAALARSLTHWTGGRRHRVEVERTDRQHPFAEVDVTRTVGPFAVRHPFSLSSEPAEPPVGTVGAVVEAWRAVPGGGLGWPTFAYGAEPPPAAGPADLVFCYRGVRPQPASGAFRVVAEPIGGGRSPASPRRYQVEVEAVVVTGTLEVRWGYSDQTLSTTTVQRLAEQFLTEIRQLIAAAHSVREAAPQPADFPLARVRHDQLADLLRRL